MAAVWFTAAVILLAGIAGTCAGSCRDAGLCCTGRDATCAVLDGGKPSCYCDHACVKVGDCCRDFNEVCGASDCQVSGWGHWSDCSVDCGLGTMERTRHVTRDVSNGGQACPDLVQKRSCHGNKCETRSHGKSNRETAMLLPATYSTIRHLNATQDIRNNLRLRYRKDPEEENSKDYCVMFEVTKTRKSCEAVASVLAKKGAEVCVACEAAAIRRHLGYRCQGHGVDHKQTGFALLAYQQCTGLWKRKSVQEKCRCEGGKADFIFV
ncbi:hypothetical protein JTE90_021812 [Oedothorax gibbosus]|uniref:SMB domain-containing protein n=1 Tax=Oedothorax gibbosus TaxID=931172 RepID=A0AAV6TYS8_9ARAC|nr:hypothetical protein JTE90_021812 [Oedothorax gibbosus]